MPSSFSAKGRSSADTAGAALRNTTPLYRALLPGLAEDAGEQVFSGYPSRLCLTRNIPKLYSPRAPGNTCLSTLRSGEHGSIEAPINNSKGCGGVMRVAPVGLYFNGRKKDIRDICRFGAETAALTHGHPHGWMPAAALAQIVHEVSQDGTILPEAVLHSLNTIDKIYPETKERIAFTNLIEKAIDLAAEDMDDLDAIHLLGEGWVGDETLAIAVYCALKYSVDIDSALIAAVNHNGDSDSTGANTGNIIGAQAGLSGIPEKYTEKLELRDLIIEVADDLWHDCRISEYGSERDPVMEQQYIEMTYGKRPCAVPVSWPIRWEGRIAA